MAQQQIHIASKSYRLPHAPSYVVLVMAKGEEYGRYFRVNNIALELLRRGWTPEKIGLEPIEDDDRD